MKKIITMVTILVLCVFTVIIINQQSIDETHAIEKGLAHTQKSNNVTAIDFEDVKHMTTTDEQEELSHEKIVELTDKFMDLLVQEIDENYRVIHYQTKDELMEAFDPYVKKEAVKPYIDFYYNEKQDGLYIVPTETPPWFEKTVDYEKNELDEHTTEIIQTNQSDLYGKYVIKIEFEQVDNKWKISNISNE